MKYIIFFLCAIITIQAQVVKIDNTMAFGLNGSSADRFFNYTAADFNTSPTSIVERVTISVQFAVEDLELFFEARNEDLALRLTSPLGTTVDLVYDSSGIFTGTLQTPTFSGTTVNMSTIQFDDMATTAVSANADPTTGTFRPEQHLSLFQNESAIGTWKLEIGDGIQWSTGDEITYFSSTISIYPSTSLSINSNRHESFALLKFNVISHELHLNDNNFLSISYLKIFDLNGRLIKKVIAPLQSVIDVSELETGYYIIKMFDKHNKTLIEKFIKN